MAGLVRNYSRKSLWVIETDSGPARAHLLHPGQQSPAGVDADGVKAVDGTPISGHRSWWKLPSVSTADINQSGTGLTINCWLGSKVADNEFGAVTFDRSPGWGVPL